MATIARFKLPDVGEGLTEAEVIAWVVAVGDTVEVNQPLCEIETAKSAVELPSPVAGVVETLHVEEGESVEVGTVLVSLRVGTADKSRAAAAAESGPAETEIKNLVGTGPSALVPRKRHLRPRSELPSGIGRFRPATLPGAAREIRIPIRGVRKATAMAMITSAFTAPHVTEWLAVDITETMQLVRTLKADPQWAGVRVNPMLFVAKALLMAIGEHPEVNARWDEANQEIVQYGGVNLGIAAATPRGLVVPNIKDADSLSLRELAAALEQLIDSARAGTQTPADMSRGTVTITNIGALGVDAGTPILNPGEAAILAFGAIRETPWVINGQIQVRQVTQLALSFDHRLVDGELGSHILTTTAAVLTHPVQSLLRAG